MPWAMAGNTKHGTQSLGTVSGVEANALSLPETSVASVWLQAGGCWSPLRANPNPTQSAAPSSGWLSFDWVHLVPVAGPLLGLLL